MFERRMIYTRINDNAVGRTGYSNELDTLYDGQDTVRVIERRIYRHGRKT
jgi:hypothetical protein